MPTVFRFRGSTRSYSSLLAAACMNFSKVDPAPDETDRYEAVEKLYPIINRIAWVHYEDFPDEKDGPTFYWPVDEETQPVVIERGEDGVWQFSAEMIAVQISDWPLAATGKLSFRNQS